MPSSYRRSWLAPLSLAAVVFAVVFAVYVPGLDHGFVWIDHSEIVAGTMRVESWEELGALFLRSHEGSGYHRPVYQLLHSLDHWVWGLRPFGYHLSSALLHALNAALLLTLLRRAGYGAAAALAIAGLWALHPVQTAVAGLIHAKADVFSLTCMLISLLAWQRIERAVGERRTPWAWTVGLASFAVATWTKEIAFLLPVALTLRCCVATPARAPRAYLAALWALAIALGAFHLAATAGSVTPPPQLGLAERLLTFTTVYINYLALLELPLWLSMSDTVTRFGALPVPTQVAALVAFGALVAVQVWAARRWATLRKWIVLYNLALLPVAQLVPILHFRADRYLYLPSIAFVGAIVDTVRLLATGPLRARFSPARLRAALACVAGLVAILFGARSVTRLADFEDDRTLFQKEIARTPDYLEGLTHFGRALENAGSLRDAETCYRQCLEPPEGRVSYVDRDAVLVNLTNNLLAQGRPAEAFDLAGQNLDSMRAPSHRDELVYNRAVAAYNLQRFGDALAGFADYAERHPGDAACLYLAGVSAHEVGDPTLAARYLRAYLDREPDDPDRVRDARRRLESL